MGLIIIGFIYNDIACVFLSRFLRRQVVSTVGARCIGGQACRKRRKRKLADKPAVSVDWRTSLP